VWRSSSVLLACSLSVGDLPLSTYTADRPIDDIEFPPPKEPVKDILGGAGSWSALGARLFSPPPKSKSVGWVVDAGLDFPVELRQIIQSWETSCVLRETPERKTTRGHNTYGENEERGKCTVT